MPPEPPDETPERSLDPEIPGRQAPASGNGPEGVRSEAVELGGDAEPAAAGLAAHPERAPTWFRRLILYTVASALAAALPVPLLDDRLVRAVRRRMVRELARDQGVVLDEVALHHLSGTESKTALGCFLGVLLSVTFKIAVKLLRRVFRTILFWLLVKDMTNAASKTFHEGYLIRLGMPRLRYREDSGEKAGAGDPSRPPPAPATASQAELWRNVWEMRARVEQVCRESDTRLFQKLFKESLGGSTRLLRGAARRVLGTLRRRRVSSDEEQEAVVEAEVPQPIVDRLLRALSAESGYLQQLERRWRETGVTPQA